MVGTDTLNEAISRLAERFRPERIILFGSHASGKAREDSDVDLLVVADTQLSAIESFCAASRALADLPAAFDVIVRTPDEYRRRRSVVNDIAYLADKYGAIVYER